MSRARSFRARARRAAATAGVAGLALASLAPAVQAQESYLVVLAGLGGEPSYREKFHEWALSMREAAIGRYGLAPDKVFYLGEDPELAPGALYAKSTKENVTELFGELRDRVKPGDQLFVLLIGHGSYRSEQSRFNLPGPDLTAADFDALLQPFQEQSIVFVNAASASGSFLPVLSKENRIVVTATKSGMERNETLFGKYFVEAYAGDGADTDKNQRVSVLEAFQYARLSVARHYEEENLLQTEHAVLDDDGDGEGVDDPGEAEGDFAGAAYLHGATASASAPGAEELASDPELRALFDRKQELESRIAALRSQKDSMPEEIYLQELERLLLELAETAQTIQEKREP